jgi:DNA-binding FadR family transcriptional regulator
MIKIVSGAYRSGEMLPSEGDLGEEYGVSRTVVREAVKIVEHKRLVSVVQGRGSTVLPSGEWNVLDPSIIAVQLELDADGRVYEELMLVRMALESEMAAEAATHLTPMLEQDLLVAIEQSLAHQSEPDVMADHDYRFHRLITDASGNRIGRGIMASLEDPLRVSIRMSHRVPHEGIGADEYHAPIFEAIAAHEPALARQRMHEHISSSWQELRSSGLLRPTEWAAPSD